MKISGSRVPDWRESVLCAALAAGVVAALASFAVAARVPRLGEDERDYLRAAVHLARAGVFSHAPIESPGPAPDAFREPAYPALVAAVWRLASQRVPESEAAFEAEVAGGGAAARTARALNLLLLGGAAAAAAWGARLAGASRPWAWAAALAVAASPALRHAGALLASESLAAVTVGLAGAGLAAAVADRRLGWLVLAGLAAGVSPLARASTVVLIPAGALLFALVPRRLPLRARGSRAALFLLLASACVLPWVLRNRAVTGHAVLADRGGVVLAIRAALDAQLEREGLLPALLEWTPLDAAREARRERYPESRIARYTWTDDGNYFTRTVRRWRAAQGGGGDRLAVDSGMGRQALADFVAHPVAHLRATVATAWRGAFAERAPAWTAPLDDVVAFGLGLALAGTNLVLLALAVRRRDPRPVALLLPALALFAAHAAVTEFLPRFGVPALPLVWAGVALLPARLARE